MASKYSNKYTIDSIKEIANKYNYICLSNEYINNHTKLKFQCPVGHTFEMRYNRFQQGDRCPNCSKNKKNTIENVKEFSKEINYICLSDKYINNKSKLKFQCPVGHIFEMNFNNFKSGSRCPTCMECKKYNIKEVKEIANKYNYICKSNKYKNNKTKLLFECSIGHEFEMNLDCFLQGNRCPNCYEESRYGENNPRYNPNREEIKLNQRLRHPRRKSWIKKHMTNDPNYNDWLKSPNDYELDHKIPIYGFCKYLSENNLNEIYIKRIANKKENLQLLTKEENRFKSYKYDENEMKNYIGKFLNSKQEPELSGNQTNYY